MRLCGLDLETTGLDTSNDRITELGYVLWDSDKKKPLLLRNEFLYAKDYEEKFTAETVSMMNRVCGITPELLEEFGKPPERALENLEHFVEHHKVDFLVCHNGGNYDRPLLNAELRRHGLTTPILDALPLIDTRTDLPFVTEPDSRKLKHLALDCGFVPSFAHRAVFDVLTMLRVLSHYDLNEVITLSKVPWVTIRALVSYEQRELAKAQRFSWEKLGDKTYQKSWVKKIRENQWEQEKKNCQGFEIVQIE